MDSDYKRKTCKIIREGVISSTEYVTIELVRQQGRFFILIATLYLPINDFVACTGHRRNIN